MEERMKYRIGIDLGGTNIKAGLVDQDNKIIAASNTPTNTDRPWQEIVRSMAELAARIVQEGGASIEECIGIGIGSPGTVDSENGVVLYSNNFGWSDIPLKDELKKYFTLPICISNDANCAVLGETKAGAAKGQKNVILLTLGTGVGGGIIINGEVFEGGAPGGAELGHMTLETGGIMCTCGHRGCLEMYASATGLIAQSDAAIKANPQSLMNELVRETGKLDGTIPFKAAKEGDETAVQVINNYIKYLGDGIVGIINVFRPDMVLISGGVSNAGDALIKPLNAYVKEQTFGRDKTKTADIQRATLGNDAGIIGAANLIKGDK